MLLGSVQIESPQPVFIDGDHAACQNSRSSATTSSGSIPRAMAISSMSHLNETRRPPTRLDASTATKSPSTLTTTASPISLGSLKSKVHR